MNNNFKVTFTDVSRGAKVEATASSQRGIVNHAFMSSKHGRDFAFTKHDGNTWVTDPETLAMFEAKVKTSQKNSPDTGLAAQLASLASLANDLAKIGARKNLTHDQKLELVAMIKATINQPGMVAYVAETPSNTPEPIHGKVETIRK